MKFNVISETFNGDTFIHELFKKHIERTAKKTYGIDLVVNLKEGYREYENQLKKQWIENSQ